jgi:ribosomal protein L37AE/L43A
MGARIKVCVRQPPAAERERQVSTPGPKATFTTERCSTCPNKLTLSDVSHGLRRCRQCRVNHPRGAQTRELRENEKCPESWWAKPDLPRDGLTAFAESQKVRQSRGVRYFSQEALDVSNKRTIAKMRGVI